MKKKRSRRKLSSIEQAKRREEVLRPHGGLGYDHYVLALHMIQREAFSTAESELLHAVWLNPYEARFMRQLAWCLYRMGKYDEAREWIFKALQQKPDVQETKDIMQLIEEKKE